MNGPDLDLAQLLSLIEQVETLTPETLGALADLVALRAEVQQRVDNGASADDITEFVADWLTT